MKRIFLLLIASIICRFLFAQAFWEHTNGPQGLNIQILRYSPQGIFYAIDSQQRLFRSQNTGLSWEEITGPFTGEEIQTLKVGFKGTLFYLDSDWQTIYRSDDQGMSWTPTTNPFSSRVFTEDSNGAFLVASMGSIMRTYDYMTWDTLYLNPNSWGNTGIFDLGWLPDGQLAASAGYCYSPGSNDFFLISGDNGITWNSMPGTSLIDDLASLGNGLYFFISDCSLAYRTGISNSAAIPIDYDFIFPPNDDVVVTPAGDIISSDYYQSRISQDGGNTWQPYDGSVYNSLSVNMLPGNILMRGNTIFGNAMRSSDLGKSWKFSGYGVEDSWVTDWTFKGSNKIFGLSEAGMWRSTDTGEHWMIAPSDSVTSLLELKNNNLVVGPDEDLYVCRQKQLLRSTDDGETYIDISPDSLLSRSLHVSVHPQTGDLYLTGDSILLRSTDKGSTWEVLNTAFKFSYDPIVFHPAGTFYMIAYKSDGAGSSLIRSDNEGVTWIPVDFNPPYNWPQIIEIASDGKIVVLSYNRFYSSFDNGVTWKKNGLPPIDPWVLKLNSEGHVYAAGITDRKIYKTENDGLSWTALPELPSAFIKGIADMAFDEKQNLWVSTWGGGQFITTQSTVNITQPEPQLYSLDVFPNPSTGGFWVKWEGNNESEPAVLRLRDMSGRIILEQPVQNSPAYITFRQKLTGLYFTELYIRNNRVASGKIFLK